MDGYKAGSLMKLSILNLYKEQKLDKDKLSIKQCLTKSTKRMDGRLHLSFLAYMKVKLIMIIVILIIMNYRDRRVEMHSKYINHLASLMSNIVSYKWPEFELSYTNIFGTSVRKDDREFGVLHCRFSKYHEILCN